MTIKSEFILYIDISCFPSSITDLGINCVDWCFSIYFHTALPNFQIKLIEIVFKPSFFILHLKTTFRQLSTCLVISIKMYYILLQMFLWPWPPLGSQHLIYGLFIIWYILRPSILHGIHWVINMLNELINM